MGEKKKRKIIEPNLRKGETKMKKIKNEEKIEAKKKSKLNLGRGERG